MAKISKEAKEIMNQEGGSYFDIGVHKVYIEKLSRGETKNGTPFFQADVVGDEDPDTKATVNNLWTTDAATPYTMRTLQGILTHNAKEADKDKARDYMQSLDDTDDLDVKKFNGAEAWLEVTEDREAPKPNGGYYKRYRLWSFAKQSKPTVEELMGGGEKVNLDEVPFED